MKLTRRNLLAAAAAIGLTGALTGCETLEDRLTTVGPEDSAIQPPPCPSPEIRVLSRCTFGVTETDIHEIESRGIDGYVDWQLAPEAIDEPGALTWRLGAIEDDLAPDYGVLYEEDDHQLVRTLAQAALLRAVYSRRQLYERTVEFWNDHFNVYSFKARSVPQYRVMSDRLTIRKYAYGSFRDLLGATARSASMLGYLDNAVSRKRHPNENYARELLELHTLGVHEGYTLRDIQEVARCFTGWTIDTGWSPGAFRFESDWHDDGPKTVLGNPIPAGGGIRDGETVLDILASHPSTAKHVSTKLLARFHGDPSSAQIASTAKIFTASGGQTKPLLRSILADPALADAPPILRRPFDFVAGALRALDADSSCAAPLQDALARMGQPLFAWPMPNGYSDTAEAWTGDLIERWRFALNLASGNLPETSVNWDAHAQVAAARRVPLSEHLIGLLLPEPTLLASQHRPESGSAPSHFRGGPGRGLLRGLAPDYPVAQEFAALVMMSPQFQWR